MAVYVGLASNENLWEKSNSLWRKQKMRKGEMGTLYKWIRPLRACFLANQ